MAAPAIFRIPIGATGTFALSIVDRADSGYLDSWQAPDGKRLPAAVVADYASDSGTWKCQVTGSTLTSSPNITTSERAGTFCEAPGQSTVVGEDTFTIDLGFFQDPHVRDGLSAFLYENRTKEAYVYFGADGDNPPRMIGRIRLVSGSIGGDAHTDLTATTSFPLMSAPDIQFGTSGSNRVVRGDRLANTATAGNPGTWVPATAGVPANLAALQASGIIPTGAQTAWTTGQRIVLGDGSNANWTGTAWAAGAHA